MSQNIVNEERNRAGKQVTKESEQNTEGKVKVDLKKLFFFTFIAGVVNATKEVKSKN